MVDAKVIAAHSSSLANGAPVYVRRTRLDDGCGVQAEVMGCVTRQKLGDAAAADLNDAEPEAGLEAVEVIGGQFSHAFGVTLHQPCKQATCVFCRRAHQLLAPRPSERQLNDN